MVVAIFVYLVHYTTFTPTKIGLRDFITFSLFFAVSAQSQFFMAKSVRNKDKMLQAKRYVPP